MHACREERLDTLDKTFYPDNIVQHFLAKWIQWLTWVS